MKVFNDNPEALDKKQCCVSLFSEFSKVFDTVDHRILFDCLKATGFSEHDVEWFAIYLSGRTQTVQLVV